MLSGDIPQIEKAFGGHNSKRKLTSEIEAYARGSFTVIRDRVKNFSQVILHEIESRYNVTLSGESLRPIFNDERMKSNNTYLLEEHAPSPSAPEQMTGLSVPNQESESEIKELFTIPSSPEIAETETTAQKRPRTVTDSLPDPEAPQADLETPDEINDRLEIFQVSGNSGRETTKSECSEASSEREFETETIEEEAIYRGWKRESKLCARRRS